MSQTGLIHLFWCLYITTRQLQDFYFCLLLFTKAIQTSNYIVCTHPFHYWGERGGGGGGESSLLSNLQKGELDRISVFREWLLRKRGWPFLGVLQFLHKNKLKSVIFNVKKVYKQKIFSVRTWETLTKNLAILLKVGMELMTKSFSIMMGVHWKIWFLRGLHKKTIYSRELPKKQACAICRFNLRRELSEKEDGWSFWKWGLIPKCTLWISFSSWQLR